MSKFLAASSPLSDSSNSISNARRPLFRACRTMLLSSEPWTTLTISSPLGPSQSSSDTSRFIGVVRGEPSTTSEPGGKLWMSRTHDGCSERCSVSLARHIVSKELSLFMSMLSVLGTVVLAYTMLLTPASVSRLLMILAAVRAVMSHTLLSLVFCSQSAWGTVSMIQVWKALLVRTELAALAAAPTACPIVELATLLPSSLALAAAEEAAAFSLSQMPLLPWTARSGRE